MYITQECGQRWWRKTSWYYRYPRHTVNNIKFRRLNYQGRTIGIAFGPIMVFRGRREQ